MKQEDGLILLTKNISTELVNTQVFKLYFDQVASINSRIFMAYVWSIHSPKNGYHLLLSNDHCGSRYWGISISKFIQETFLEMAKFPDNSREKTRFIGNPRSY